MKMTFLVTQTSKINIKNILTFKYLACEIMLRESKQSMAFTSYFNCDLSLVFGSALFKTFIFLYLNM